MTTRTILLSSTLILATLVHLVPAHADPWDPCACYGGPCLGIITIGTGKADSVTFYVDDRGYVFGNGMWVYQETNGRDGLQRGGESPYIPSDGDWCRDDPALEPDTFVW